MSDIIQHEEPIKVLIVEDVESDALLLVDYLEESGYTLDWQRVDTEDNMIAALQQRWDIVFSDYSMPKFSGARALDILRQYDIDTPLIFVSGTIGEDVAVQAMREGAQDYVMKGNLTRLQSSVERELRESHQRRLRRKDEETLRKLSQALKQAADSIFITGPEGNIEYVNPAFENLTGYLLEEAKGRTPDIISSGKHNTDFHKNLWSTIRDGNVYRDIITNRRKNGELFHEERVITPLKNDDGIVTHFVSTGRDITERVRLEKDHTRFASILEITPDMVAILEADGRLLYLNDTGRRWFGIKDSESIGGNRLENIFPDLFAEQLNTEVLPAARCDGVWMGESTLLIDEDINVPVSQVVLAHHDANNNIDFFSIIARDITERKQLESELQHQATHDSLTTLPNRFFLADHFQLLLEQANRQQNCVAVLFIDLDNFKRINDSLGHEAGDKLLQQFSTRLLKNLRPSDTIARLGGDEFTIIIPGLRDADTAVSVLHKIRSSFSHPIMIGSHEVYVTFSTGIAIYPSDGDQVADLLRNADIAMYRAKSSGSNQYRFYSPDMNTRGHELLMLEAGLQHALSDKEFRLYFQPQVDLRTNKITGVEALIRWQHKTQGLISPLDFIPLLESSGLIVEVGEWVIKTACKQHRIWKEMGYGDIRISVNVSATQFRDAGLLQKITQALHDESMSPDKLELEITENVVMHDPEGAAKVLKDLSALGVRIAIDDFGTGYSSLSYLKRFPLNVLKIDKTFVSELPVNPDDSAIVEASISLGHKLGLEIVAEGVETIKQLEFLHGFDCDIVQGYYFSRPVPEKGVITLLEKEEKWSICSDQA